MCLCVRHTSYILVKGTTEGKDLQLDFGDSMEHVRECMNSAGQQTMCTSHFNECLLLLTRLTFIICVCMCVGDFSLGSQTQHIYIQTLLLPT